MSKELFSTQEFLTKYKMDLVRFSENQKYLDSTDKAVDPEKWESLSKENKSIVDKYAKQYVLFSKEMELTTNSITNENKEILKEEVEKLDDSKIDPNVRATFSVVEDLITNAYKLIKKYKVYGIINSQEFSSNVENPDKEISQKFTNIVNAFDLTEPICNSVDETIIGEIFSGKIYNFSPLWKEMLFSNSKMSLAKYLNIIFTALSEYIKHNNIDISNKRENITNIDNYTKLLVLNFATVLVVKDFVLGKPNDSIPVTAIDFIYSGKYVDPTYIYSKNEQKSSNEYKKDENYNYLLKGFTMGQNIKAYNNIPFFATEIIEQIKKDITPDKPAVTFGRNEKADLVTDFDFFNDMDTDLKTITVAAGSGSGKGVLGLVILATALRKNMPLIYLDCKPDMARTLFNACADNENSFTIDGLSNEENVFPKKAINRKVKDKIYYEYAKETMPKEFVELIGDDLVARLTNIIAYTRTVELIANFINKTSGPIPTAERPLFVIDEIQKYSKGLNELMFAGKKQDSLGGAIGKIIENSTGSSNTAKNYFTQLQTWITKVWSAWAGSKSATFRQANFSMMIILQNGETFKLDAPKFLYDAVSQISRGGTFLYGRESYNNSNFSSSSYIAQLKGKSEFSECKRQTEVAERVLQRGKFLYVGKGKISNGKPVQLNTCFIVNDGIDPKTKCLIKDGNLDKVFGSDEGVNNIIKRRIWNEIIPDSELYTRPVSEDGYKLDFYGYSDWVLNYGKSNHYTLGQKLNEGFEYLKKYAVIKEKISDNFYENFFDFNAEHMGIATTNREFIDEIIKILRKKDDFTMLYKGKYAPILLNEACNSYTLNVGSDTGLASDVVIDDDGGFRHTEDIQNIENESGFLYDLQNNTVTRGLYEAYIKQLDGECSRPDAAIHESIFNELVKYYKARGFSENISSNEGSESIYIKTLANKASDVGKYGKLTSKERPIIELREETNCYVIVDPIIEGLAQNNTEMWKLYSSQLAVEGQKGPMVTDKEAETQLIVWNSLNKLLADENKNTDYSGLNNELKKALNDASKKNAQDGDITAFNNIKNRLLNEYSNNPEALDIINSFVLNKTVSTKNSSEDFDETNLSNEESEGVAELDAALSAFGDSDKDLSRKMKLLKQYAAEGKVPVSAISVKVAQMKDRIQQNANGKLSLFESGDYNGLIATKGIPVEMMSTEQVKLFRNGKFDDIDLANLKDNFMKKFWKAVRTNENLGNGKTKTRTVGVGPGAIFEEWKGLKIHEIKQLVLNENEAIVNKKRINLAQEVADISLIDVWNFRDDDFLGLYNLEALSLSLPFIEKLVHQLGLSTDKYGVGKAATFWAFKHFKKLQILYIGQQPVKKAEYKEFNSAQIDAQLKADKLTKLTYDLAMKNTHSSLIQINNIKHEDELEDVSSGKDKGSRHLKDDYNHSHHDHMHGGFRLKGIGRFAKGAGRLITWPIRFVGGILNRIFHFI